MKNKKNILSVSIFPLFFILSFAVLLPFIHPVNTLDPDTNLSSNDASFLGESSNSYSGVAVAIIGDVNNDSYDDILIGASGYNSNTGKAYLILGRQDVTQWNGSNPLDLNYANGSATGEATQNNFGISVAGVGDINNDGLTDFAIGATGISGYMGKTYLYFGRNSLSTLGNPNASLIGEHIGDYSGYSIAGAGDVNGDGFDDILIGAPLKEDPVGKIYLVLGRETSKWTLAMPLSEANASFLGEDAGDSAGSSLAGIGDINNDGNDDFLIGEWGADAGGADAGMVYLMLGRTNVTQWNNSDPLSLSYANATFIGETANAEAGYSVTGVGDVNKDGFPDILIGAKGYNAGTGKAYLIFGRENVELWNKPFNLSDANATFNGESGSDWFGSSVAGAGDVNNDSYPDFLIGAEIYGAAATGKTYFFLGHPSEYWTTPVTPDATFIGEAASNRAGLSISCGGDVNGDGFDDILIGAPLNSERAASAGKTYLILGNDEGGTVPVSEFQEVVPLILCLILVILSFYLRTRHKTS